MGSPLISIVIPNYNSAGYVDLCLQSIVNQSYSNHEIIFVDDLSEDDSPKLALKFPIKLILSKVKLYAGGARETGFKEANGDFILYVDSDVSLPPEWLEKALKIIQLDEKIGGVGGALILPMNSNLFSWTNYLCSFSAYFPNQKKSKRVFLPTSCVLFRKYSLEGISFPHSYGDEDVQMSSEIIGKGFDLIFDPSLLAVHYDNRDTFDSVLRAQERYANGLAFGWSKNKKLIYILKYIPYMLFIPVFTTAKIFQILLRVLKSPTLLKHFIQTLPLQIIVLLKRSYFIKGMIRITK